MNSNTPQPVHTLLERERQHLRDAYRATRAALEAEFFGDEVTCHNRMVEAQEATYAALVCALEAADLMGRTFDSSALAGSTNIAEGE